MKVGLSLSRCVRDIVEGRTDINDVLIIIARTDFDPTDSKQWEAIWNGYQSLSPEWRGLDHDAVYAVVMELWNSAKIHQPRKFGARPPRRPEIWLETVLPSSELESNLTAKEAWEQFQVIAGLTNVNMDKEYR